MNPSVDVPDRAAHPVWTRPDRELWVASTAERYLGMVERIEDRFVAFDATGASRGVFVRLHDAQRAVDGLDTASSDSIGLAELGGAAVA